MEQFTKFLLQNFFLLCLTLGVIFMVLRSYRTKRIVVLMPILVVSLALLLSILYAVEMGTKSNPDLVFLTTLCFALAFILRPLVLYFFMRMTIKDKIVLIIAQVLMGINAVVYLLSLFLFAPAVSHLVLYYENGEAIRGPLFYICHGVVGLMMAYFIYYSFKSLSGKHRGDALACLITAGFVGIAVLLETFLVADYLLNTTIAISCLFYVVHLYQQASIHDALTNLFDRKAYYSDLAKVESKVKGIIVVDMNSLKYLNDNKGHEAGDEALKTIAEIIYKSLDSKHMDAYRMGGDEFTILSTSSREAAILNTVNNIRERISKTPYSIAIGYAIREDNSLSIEDLGKIAEAKMYQDKSDYYKESGIERRKR